MSIVGGLGLGPQHKIYIVEWSDQSLSLREPPRKWHTIGALAFDTLIATRRFDVDARAIA
jgi:hypothetical protein